MDWSEVSFIDREALLALDGVLSGASDAEVTLGFWLGFSEGMSAFRSGAYADALAKGSARRRGQAGGNSAARKADQRWRAKAREILPRIVEENPSYGRQRLVSAVLDSADFTEMSNPPSEGSLTRLIQEMRKAGVLPPRESDSTDEP